MNFEDVERIKSMKCIVFNEDGFFEGYVTVHILDGEEFESGGIIRETGLSSLTGWGEMDGDDCVDFEIEGRGGRYTTTFAEWFRCVETGDFCGLGFDTWRSMRKAEYAEKSMR